MLNYIEIEKIEKKIILLSENLQKKSKIRNIVEKNNTCACIACYEDDEKTLKNILRQRMNEIGIKITNENLEQLFSINKLNRNDINGGIEKLKLITNFLGYTKTACSILTIASAPLRAASDWEVCALITAP